VAGLERKVELSRQLLNVVDILDPGLSQFRGLTLYDLFLGQLGLALTTQGVASPEELSAAVRTSLCGLLEDCLRCLSIEKKASHPGRVAAKAADFLAKLKPNTLAGSG
jgi:hypothetical protein